MTVNAGPRVLIETVGRVRVVSFTEAEILADDAIQGVAAVLAGLLDQFGGVVVLIDFREVRHMSSGLIAVLVAFERRLARLGGRLALCSIEPGIREVFRITQFDHVVAILDDEVAALDALEAAPLRHS